MSDAETRAGRARVRRVLIAPLVALLRRPRSVSAADHAAMLDALEARLCWMTEPDLRALMLGVVEGCALRANAEMPDAEAILRLARELAEAPERDSAAVRSWMASRAGEAALAEGEGVAVALYLHLKRHGPQRMAWPLIRATASEREERLRRARALGPGDVWAERELANWERDRARALPLIGGAATAGVEA